MNLRGREAEGIVEPDDYEATCEELRTALEGLRTEDGRPVVSEVLRADPSGNPPALLPDLVVHWTYAALEWPVRIRDPAIEAWPIASNSTGQHAPDGFCVARGLGEPLDDPLEAADLPKLLRAACV